MLKRIYKKYYILKMKRNIINNIYKKEYIINIILKK